MAVVLSVIVSQVRHLPWMSDARLFASHTLALRSAAIAGEPSSSAILASMPGSGPRNLLPLLWGPFFENTVVRARSAAVLSLQWLSTIIPCWTLPCSLSGKSGTRTLLSFRYAPCRVNGLLEPGTAEASLRPQMDGSGGRPHPGATSYCAIAASLRFNGLTLRKREQMGYDDVTFAAAAADLRAALPRLVWNTVQRDQWTTESFSWLVPTLTGVETALATRNTATIKKAAPETDPDTAKAIARLPSRIHLATDARYGSGSRRDGAPAGWFTSRRRRRLHADHLPDGRRGLRATTYFITFSLTILPTVLETEKTNRGFLSVSNVIPGLTRNPEYLLMNFWMPDQVRHDTVIGIA